MLNTCNYSGSLKIRLHLTHSDSNLFPHFEGKSRYGLFLHIYSAQTSCRMFAKYYIIPRDVVFSCP
jgi:hypothetical protein